jgi:signal transduction histidine kinase
MASMASGPERMSITDRAIRQLAAAMAHEVRNPLNSMAIHADLMEGRLNKPTIDSEGLKKSAAVLQHEIVRIDHILEEYLAHAGPIEGTRQPIAPRTLLDAAFARLEPEAAPRKVRLSAEIIAANAEWLLDVEAFGEALDAVIRNAVEASPTGGTVVVRAAADGYHADITVIDRGEGVAEEDLPRLFRIGFSTHSRAGVGLTVARQIVKGHGGSIDVASGGRGKGAQVRIRVPIDQDA